MSKRSTILDPAQSEAGTIQWIQSTVIQLPKLSPMALQSSAFDHYDKGLKDGEPTAAKIAAGLMNLPELDQKTAAARRSEWSRSRCVEYLRSEIFRSNKELVSIAKETKSDAIHVAIIDAIYNAIATAYPHIKAEAADMAVRKKLELAKNGRKTNAAAMSQTLGSEPPAVTPGAPEATLAEAKQNAADDADVKLVRQQATQVVNAMLICLRECHENLVPEAAKFGVVLDSQAEHSWAMSAWITLSSGSKAHWKMPTERCL